MKRRKGWKRGTGWKSRRRIFSPSRRFPDPRQFRKRGKHYVCGRVQATINKVVTWRLSLQVENRNKLLRNASEVPQICLTP